jgi:glyoxylase-like metal-dependent hydrolase (beta-lactamase superfamily II)
MDADNIRILTAGNVGPFTGNGTNTYLVGGERLAVIDPGPEDNAHLAAILAAARGRAITHILLTHAHRDHADGISALKAATGAVTVGFGRSATVAAIAGKADSSPSGGDFIDWSFVPEVRARHGDRLEAGDVVFEAVYTPGHAPDHMCFALEGQMPVLFSGDHVMGWSTSVIAPPEGRMGDYLRSLELLLTRGERRYLPGHGEAIPDGQRTARAYLLHRQMREQAVLGAIRDGLGTIPAITERVYEGIGAQLLNAARLSVQAHVELLAEKGTIAFEGPLMLAERITPIRQGSETGI